MGCAFQARLPSLSSGLLIGQARLRLRACQVSQSVFFGQYTSRQASAAGRSSRCSSYRQEAITISQATLVRQRKPACRRCIARHTQRASSFPEGSPCSPILSSPLETRCVRETVLHTLRPRVAKSAFPQFEQAFCCGGHRLSTTLPWLHLGHGPFFPEWPGPQCDLDTRSTRQTRSTHLVSQATPNSSLSRSLSKQYLLSSNAVATLSYSTST